MTCSGALGFGVCAFAIYLCPSVLSVVKTAFVLDEHLLQQAAFEGLGVGDLLRHAFDLTVQCREEVRDLGLFGEGRQSQRRLFQVCLIDARLTDCLVTDSLKVLH